MAASLIQRCYHLLNPDYTSMTIIPVRHSTSTLNGLYKIHMHMCVCLPGAFINHNWIIQAATLQQMGSGLQSFVFFLFPMLHTTPHHTTCIFAQTSCKKIILQNEQFKMKLQKEPKKTVLVNFYCVWCPWDNHMIEHWTSAVPTFISTSTSGRPFSAWLYIYSPLSPLRQLSCSFLSSPI